MKKNKKRIKKNLKKVIKIKRKTLNKIKINKKKKRMKSFKKNLDIIFFFLKINIGDPEAQNCALLKNVTIHHIFLNFTISNIKFFN